MIDGLSIRTYRSFGIARQKILANGNLNIVIGKNNVGKSNFLRALTFLLPRASKNDKMPDWNPLLDASSYAPEQPAEIGLFIPAPKIQPQNFRQQGQHQLNILQHTIANSSVGGVWFYMQYSGDRWVPGPIDQEFAEAIKQTAGDNRALQNMALNLIGTSQGQVDRDTQAIAALFNPFREEQKTALVPAIRSTNLKGPSSSSIQDDLIYVNGIAELSGTNLIDRIVKLQNPTISELASRRRYRALNDFLRATFQNDSAIVSVPHTKESIYLEMDGDSRPISSYGSGLEQVAIIAAAATVLENHILCLEEPETNLHPEYQIRLLSYLRDQTQNQFFITTHSSSVINLDRASVFQARLTKSGTELTRILDSNQQHHLVFDLGYRPSDLAQSNSIIWVEGPSDRIYLKAAIAGKAPELLEGVDFSIVFYGGKLLSHLSIDDAGVDDFILLSRVNRRSCIVIDSDKAKASDAINATKQRVVKEFTDRGLFVWISEGREIENYLDPAYYIAAIEALYPAYKPQPTAEFDDLCKLKPKQQGKDKDIDKVRLAHQVAENFDKVEFRLDWQSKIQNLIAFIKASK